MKPSLMHTHASSHGLPQVPWDPSMCNKTAGMFMPASSHFEHSTYSVLPPVTSAQMRTARTFRFGRLEVRARLPQGDHTRAALQP